ncbi:MAG: CorA family divalent cation transporter [Patescibacteria group bacterium]
MVTRHESDGIIWTDLESPTREELEDVMTQFDIDGRIEEEIISPTPYPLVVSAPHYQYLILHFPSTDPRGGARNQEIDFIVGKNFLVTARYEVISTIHNLHRVFESEELLGLPKREKGMGALLERILRQLYGAISDEAEQTARLLDRIEEDVFHEKEREAVLNISLVGRVLLRFDTTLARHQEPLQTFLRELAKPSLLGRDFEKHMSHIEAEHDHAVAVVAAYRAVASELRETNDSLLSASQNEIIKRLTIMTFVALPLTVVASLFGMNNDYLPLVHTHYFFWFVIAVMAFVVTVLLSYFKHKKWL